MSSGAGPTGERLVLVVGPAPGRAAVADELVDDDPPLRVLTAGDVAAGLASVDATRGAEVGVVLLVADDAPVDGPLAALAADSRTSESRTLLVTARARHDELSDALDAGRLHGVVAVPWTAGALTGHVRSLLERTDPGDGPAGDDDAGSPLAPASELLRDFELDPATVTRRLLAALDRALGPRPVLRLRPGTRLTRQGQDVDALFVVRAGSVALERATAGGVLRSHQETTGPVVGLLSLTQRRRAYFTSRATTEVEVVHLTLEQLDRALDLEPEVGASIATAAVRALAGRLRHAEQLHLERAELNRELEGERRRLSDALEALEAARLELVGQARMATLGELSAGVAHDLNNPVAALTRAANHVAEDVEALLEDHPRAALVRDGLRQGRTSAPTTSERRTAVRELARVVADRRLAERLVDAGITDPDAAARLGADEASLRLAERAARLGSAVRDLEVAGAHVAGLVDSLRAYARPEAEPVEGIDVHETLDDALRLVAARLDGVEVVRSYGHLPPIRGHPGPLSQVWTNLLSNAAEAVGGDGRVEIRTDAPDRARVRVRVIDDGRGIDPEVLPRLFEPRFTTRRGRVHYGLGLGLAIARHVVDAHGGTIRVPSSRPGRTEVEVVLPVAGPPEPDESTERS